MVMQRISPKPLMTSWMQPPPSRPPSPSSQQPPTLRPAPASPAANTLVTRRIFPLPPCFLGIYDLVRGEGMQGQGATWEGVVGNGGGGRAILVRAMFQSLLCGNLSSTEAVRVLASFLGSQRLEGVPPPGRRLYLTNFESLPGNCPTCHDGKISGPLVLAPVSQGGGVYERASLDRSGPHPRVPASSSLLLPARLHFPASEPDPQGDR